MVHTLLSLSAIQNVPGDSNSTTNQNTSSPLWSHVIVAIPGAFGNEPTELGASPDMPYTPVDVTLAAEGDTTVPIAFVTKETCHRSSVAVFASD